MSPERLSQEISMKLTVLGEDADGATTVALTGEFDLATAGELEILVDRLISEGRNRIVLDLHDLTFCDSVGLNALVRARNRCEADGGSLRVTGSRGEVADVLRIGGLFDHLTSSDS
jgi:anti-anti-sigma factor